MSYHRSGVSAAGGFTLVEIAVVMMLAGVIVITAYTFFNTSFNQYLSLQKQGTAFTDLATQTQRLANVLRGLTDISEVSATDITCYAYFETNDTYVSQVHYYVNPQGNQLLADVTPMTANPPTGSPIPSETKTYTIIPNYYQLPGVSTFVYLDSSFNPMTLPITDLKTIKGIEVNLAVPGGSQSNGTYQTMTLQVSLRNRKTNL